MPMPLSATASSTQSRPSATLRTRKAISPSFVNLQALLKRLSRICLRRMGSAVSVPKFSCASITRRFLFFSASCPAVPMTSSMSRAKLIGSGLSSSLLCFDFGEVEYLVDEAQQMRPSGIHATQRFQRLSVAIEVADDLDPVTLPAVHAMPERLPKNSILRLAVRSINRPGYA